jgi:hypothetical protein
MSAMAAAPPALGTIAETNSASGGDEPAQQQLGPAVRTERASSLPEQGVCTNAATVTATKARRGGLKMSGSGAKPAGSSSGATPGGVSAVVCFARGVVSPPPASRGAAAAQLSATEVAQLRLQLPLLPAQRGQRAARSSPPVVAAGAGYAPTCHA